MDTVYILAGGLVLLALGFVWGARVADSAWVSSAGSTALGYRCRGVDYVVVPGSEFWSRWRRIPDGKVPRFQVARE